MSEKSPYRDRRIRSQRRHGESAIVGAMMDALERLTTADLSAMITRLQGIKAAFHGKLTPEELNELRMASAVLKAREIKGHGE